MKATILVLFAAFAVANCDLCHYTSPVPCTRLEDWQKNILCRIQGSRLADGTPAEDGYLTDALRVGLNTSNMSIAKEFDLVVNYMSTSFESSTDAGKFALLRSAEGTINRLGAQLYKSNWTIPFASCRMPEWALAEYPVVSTHKLPIQCGDRSSNPPNCPIGA